MPIIGSEIPTYEFFPNSPPSIVGELSSGLSVTIEVWKEGNAVTLISDQCNEIGSTGKYSWSTSNLGSVLSAMTQYHFRMSGGGVEDNGDFIIKTHENLDGRVPRNLSDYVLRLH